MSDFFDRCVEEIGLVQTGACITLGTVILGLVPTILYFAFAGRARKVEPQRPVMAAETQPAEPAPAEELSAVDSLAPFHEKARQLAADPAVRAELQRKAEDFSAVTVTLANRGTVSDWRSLSLESRITIVLYIATKTHPSEAPQDRAARVIFLALMVNATAENENAQDFTIEQVCRINDHAISAEIRRATWIAETDL